MEKRRLGRQSDNETERLIEEAFAELKEADRATLDRIWEGIERRIAEDYMSEQYIWPEEEDSEGNERLNEYLDAALHIEQPEVLTDPPLPIDPEHSSPE